MMSPTSTRHVGLASLVGMAFFPVAVVILNVGQLDDYNLLVQPMSQLALGAAGWLMTLAFFANGVGFLLLARATRRSLPGARVLPVILVVVGVLYFVAGAFPTDANGQPLSTHGLIHNMAGLATFALMPIAMVVAGFLFKTSPDWNPFSWPTVVWGGLAIVAFFLLFGFGAANLFGLGQRIGVGSCCRGRSS